jgi:hypothetical protein
MFWIYDFFFGFTRFPGKVYNAIENTGFSKVPGIGGWWPGRVSNSSARAQYL